VSPSVVPNQPFSAVGVTPSAPAASPPQRTGLSATLHKSSDALSLAKVLAGGMAAATSAVFGSYFGTFGTVGGAAVGSVATTVVTRLFQRSIEHTQSTVVSTVKHVVGADGGSSDDKSGVTSSQPAAAGTVRKSLDDVATVRLSSEQQAEVKKRGRRSLKMLLIGTVMIFLLALALVTGIEWAKGSPLSGGGGGTSIGHVLDPHAARPPTPVEQLPSDGDLSDSQSPSDDDSESEDPSDDNSDRHHHHSDSDSNDSGNSDRGGSADNTETNRPDHGGLLGGLSGVTGQ
jgi:hypothetical protein